MRFSLSIAALLFLAALPHPVAAQDCDDCLDGTCDACVGSDCGSECCGAGCTGCGGCATWAVGLDWVFFGRSAPDSHLPLVECACAHPHDARFAANDFEPNGASGVLLRAYRRCECGPDLEFTYLEMDEFEDNRHFYGDLTVLGTPIGTGSAYAQFDSTLRGLELNSLTDCGCWTRFLLGVRWVQLDESATVGGYGTTADVRHDIRTDNHLIGGQIGVNRLLWDNGGPWKVDLGLKTGLYANIIDRDYYGCGCAAGKDTTTLGNISEINLNGAYAINCCWSLNVGAHFLWLSGVASAPEQFYYHDYIYDDSTVFFAGGSLGFTRVW